MSTKELIEVMRSGDASAVKLAFEAADAKSAGRGREMMDEIDDISQLYAQAIVAERETSANPDPNEQLTRAIETILHDTPGHEINIRYDVAGKAFTASTLDKTCEPCELQVGSSWCLLKAVQHVAKNTPKLPTDTTHDKRVPIATLRNGDRLIRIHDGVLASIPTAGGTVAGYTYTKPDGTVVELPGWQLTKPKPRVGQWIASFNGEVLGTCTPPEFSQESQEPEAAGPPEEQKPGAPIGVNLDTEQHAYNGIMANTVAMIRQIEAQQKQIDELTEKLTLFIELAKANEISHQKTEQYCLRPFRDAIDDLTIRLAEVETLAERKTNPWGHDSGESMQKHYDEVIEQLTTKFREHHNSLETTQERQRKQIDELETVAHQAFNDAKAAIATSNHCRDKAVRLVKQRCDKLNELTKRLDAADNDRNQLAKSTAKALRYLSSMVDTLGLAAGITDGQ
jgi:hypothetical protein